MYACLVISFFFVVVRLFVELGRCLSTKLAFNILYIHPNAVGFTITFLSNPAVLQPCLRCEVDRLRAIVAKIIARVITVGKCYDEFALVVDESVDTDVKLRL